MFCIPIGDENPNDKTPYVNYTLIIINVLIYLGLGFTGLYPEIVKNFGFIPSKSIPYTYVTSMFLHGSIFHLLGNMLYLWILGDNIEDKIGHFWYLLFYLFCGIISNIFHGIVTPEAMANIPTIGASGAISAILGAYLVLFPRNKIVFFYFIWIFIFVKWGKFKLASFWALGFWFAMQLFSHSIKGGVSSVAYGAHIGGFMAGAIIIGTLVLTGILKSHWNKERNYQEIYAEEQEWLNQYNEKSNNTKYDNELSPYEKAYQNIRKENNRDDYW